MIGLVTADVAAPLDPDLRPLADACASHLGPDRVRIVSWDDTTVDWSGFDAVVLRSPWDYTERLDGFLAWTRTTAERTRLVNGPGTVAWNADKSYLAELDARGVDIVPTTFVAPGEAAPSVDGLHVVKPTVGAGSRGARRCEPHEVADHVALLHGLGLTAMVQPYLTRLDAEGETAHCYVPTAGPAAGVADVTGDGASGHGLELSHVFRKGAILTSTDVEQEGGLFAKEQIDPHRSSDAERDLADRALTTAGLLGRLDDVVYARVDVAPFRDDDGTDSFVVMELELIEPSFFLTTAPGSAERFADRLLPRLGLDV